MLNVCGALGLLPPSLPLFSGQCCCRLCFPACGKGTHCSCFATAPFPPPPVCPPPPPPPPLCLIYPSQEFKTGKNPIMLATDVAARGLGASLHLLSTVIFSVVLVRSDAAGRKGGFLLPV